MEMETLSKTGKDICKRYLKCIGFSEINSPIQGRKTWVWGSYTVKNSFGINHYEPILVWDENTQMMYCSPINYYKKITTREGFINIMNSVNYLISTES